MAQQVGGADDDAVVRAILAYLDAHPHAKDSAAGVARWWLPAGTQATPREVEAALERLVGQGRLRRVRLADGSVLYAKE